MCRQHRRWRPGWGLGLSRLQEKVGIGYKMFASLKVLPTTLNEGPRETGIQPDTFLIPILASLLLQKCITVEE